MGIINFIKSKHFDTKMLNIRKSIVIGLLVGTISAQTEESEPQSP